MLGLSGLLNDVFLYVSYIGVVSSLKRLIVLISLSLDSFLLIEPIGLLNECLFCDVSGLASSIYLDASPSSS